MKTLPQQDVEKVIIEITKQLLNESGEQHVREVRLDMSLQRHLGIDSLGRAELFRRIEKQFHVTLPDKLLAEAETLDDIVNYIETHEASAKPGVNKAKRSIIQHETTSSVDPEQANSLIDILELYAIKTPEKVHIYFQHEDGAEEAITYSHLLKSSLRVAQSLQSLGLQEGETVAIMQPTHPGFFYTFYGTLLAGGVPVPIYPPFRAHMIEAYAKTEATILNNAEVRVLVTFDKAEKLSHLLQAFVPSLKVVTTVDELLKAEESKKPFRAGLDHYAFIQYTSGSTSDPKGVLLSHANLLANIRAYGKAIEVTPQDVAVSWLPLYHDMGLIGMWLGSLYYGIPLVLMTPFSFLNHPERWLWAIHYHRGTLIGAPNFAYELCVRKADPALLEGLDLSSLKMAANGAEKVYPRTLQQFAEKFAPYGFNAKALLPVYGLAESTVGLAIPPLGRGFLVDRVDRKQFEEKREAVPSTDKNALEFVCCGAPIAGHAIRIVDDEGVQLPERHIGNLQFMGPSSMQGYYNNPRATAAVIQDGWVASGDLAYMAEGEIYITGRRKDLIIKAGRNLYPAEIEELVGNIPGVRQGCVTAFGITENERGTEQLVVVAETRETDKVKREAIQADINAALSTALDIAPDHIVLVAPRIVPKTSSGKLQRAACKRMYMEGKLGKSQTPAWLQVTKLGSKWFGLRIWSGFKTVAKFIYSVYVLSLFLLTLFPIWIAIQLVPRDRAARWCQNWVRALLFLSGCPLKKIGLSHLTDVHPVIFAANHASYIDALVTLSIVPPHTRFVGKKELLNTPIIGTFMRKLGYLAVDRLDLPKGIEDTRQMEETLKAGESLLIFPEGTFSYAQGLRPFRLGAFKIATEAEVPVCPIALHGTRSILRAGEWLLSPGRITVTVSKPIMPTGKEWQDVTKLRNAVRLEIAKHCGEPSLDLIAAQTVASTPLKMP